MSGKELPRRDIEPEGQKLFPTSILPADIQTTTAAEIRYKLSSMDEPPRTYKEKKIQTRKRQNAPVPERYIYIVSTRNPIHGVINPDYDFAIFPEGTAPTFKDMGLVDYGPFDPILACQTAYLFHENFILNNTQVREPLEKELNIYSLDDFTIGIKRLILDLQQISRETLHTSNIRDKAINAAMSKLELNFMERKAALDLKKQDPNFREQDSFEQIQVKKSLSQIAGLNYAIALLSELSTYPWSNPSN